MSDDSLVIVNIPLPDLYEKKLANVYKVIAKKVIKMFETETLKNSHFESSKQKANEI